MRNVTPINADMANQISLIESFQRAVAILDKFEVVRMRSMNEGAKYRHMNAITDMIVAEISCEDKHKKVFQNAVGTFLLRVMELVESLPVEDVVGHEKLRDGAKIPLAQDLKNAAIKKKILSPMFAQPS